MRRVITRGKLVRRSTSDEYATFTHKAQRKLCASPSSGRHKGRSWRPPQSLPGATDPGGRRQGTRGRPRRGRRRGPRGGVTTRCAGTSAAAAGAPPDRARKPTLVTEGPDPALYGQGHKPTTLPTALAVALRKAVRTANGLTHRTGPRPQRNHDRFPRQTIVQIGPGSRISRRQSAMSRSS